jgi:non-ribosomal peptide synthetase component F
MRPLPALRSPGITLTPLEAPTDAAKFDLALFAAEGPEGLQLSMEYSSDLFDPETVDRMLAHYRILLESIAAQPDRPVGLLPMLTEEERRRMLADWGNGGSAALLAGPDDAREGDLDALLDEPSPQRAPEP